MIERYFEEAIYKCKNESITSGGKCTTKGLVRRVMGVTYGIMGIYRCEKCMPDFFSNPKKYLVVKKYMKSKESDPLFENYKKFCNIKFTLESEGS
jgi:hypothetical protein